MKNADTNSSSMTPLLLIHQGYSWMLWEKCFRTSTLPWPQPMWILFMSNYKANVYRSNPYTKLCHFGYLQISTVRKCKCITVTSENLTWKCTGASHNVVTLNENVQSSSTMFLKKNVNVGMYTFLGVRNVCRMMEAISTICYNLGKFYLLCIVGLSLLLAVWWEECPAIQPERSNNLWCCSQKVSLNKLWIAN